ncbi:MAG TPA: cell division protein FtsA [Terriglobia bacterium]|jgi:cell division protein FtsA|nr:cell division protein FtsA [Terriglobia bacterium]
MARKLPFVAGLDLGDSKTCLVVCRPDDRNKLHLAGVGVAESRGWRRGAINDFDSAVLAVKKAVEAAEDAVGFSIDTAYIGVGGLELKGVNSAGAISLGTHGRQVMAEDIRRVFEVAQGIPLPPDRRLLHAERQEYLLDSQNGIRNPIGMVGTRLEVSVHLVTASTIAHENLVTAVNRAGIEVKDTVLEPLAAAEACLAPDERELGVGLLDIGRGSSELVIYHDGSLRHTAAIAVGGEFFTNDVAVGLRTPVPEAERLKLSWTDSKTGESQASFEVPSVGGRPPRVVNTAMLGEILEPRAAELVELTQTELARSRFDRALGAGLVLVGGGAKLAGLVSMAEQTLQMPVRLGQPSGIEELGELLLDPAYAAAVGLVLYGNRQRALDDSRQPGWRDRWKGFFGGEKAS